jgi:hypothetical protein
MTVRNGIAPDVSHRSILQAGLFQMGLALTVAVALGLAVLILIRPGSQETTGRISSDVQVAGAALILGLWVLALARRWSNSGARRNRPGIGSDRSGRLDDQ